MKKFPLTGQNQQSQQHQLNWLPPKEPKQNDLQQHQQISVKETDVALVVRRAAWWLPVSSSSKANATTANSNMETLTFAEAVKDFLQNFSFHCYGKLVETGRRYQEKLFWFAFHVVALSMLIIFLVNYSGTGKQLLTTSIYDATYPISEVPFPTISICSINRISNASAKRYAEELNAKDPEQRGVSYFYENIKLLHFNYYVQHNMPYYEDAVKFQQFLDSYDIEEGEQFFNTRRRMKMLTPNCSNILLKCRIAGLDFDCAQQFTETFTSKGLCCTFNYNKTYAAKRKFRQRFFGPDMGLALLLNASHKDDFSPWETMDSFEILIYSTATKPNPSSGSIKTRIVQSGEETFLAITPRIFQTVDDVRYLNPNVRNCLFRDEVPSVFGDSYTFSNCISYCRARSILVLCQCLLFMTPFENLTSSNNDTAYCSLQHRECLMRYDFKWFNVLTQRENVIGLRREMEDALYCPDCLPTCTEVRYSVTAMELPFPSYQKNRTELADVNIYFGVSYAVFYRKFLVSSWFETLSFVGNICGIIAGFSLIGICEVLFFIIQQLHLAFRNAGQNEGKRYDHKDNTKEALIIFP